MATVGVASTVAAAAVAAKVVAGKEQPTTRRIPKACPG